MKQTLLAIITLVLFLSSGCGQAGPPPGRTSVAVSPQVEPGNTPETGGGRDELETAQAATSPALPPSQGATSPTATPRETATPTPLPSPTTTPSPTPTIPPAVIEMAGETLPPGFSVVRYAKIPRPTGLAVDRDNRVYATSQDGTVHVFVDEDLDGHADEDILFSYGFYIPLGITIGPDGDSVYVSSNSRISVLTDEDGDYVADTARNLVRGLPVGLHQNDNLEFGPDGMLYMGIGSTCDACAEADPRSASLMRFDASTGAGEIVATGLRNPYDLSFHPFTGDLFATDNGRDDLGMDAPHEELNLIIPGEDYGWPGCWDEGVGPDCAGTQTAVAFFEPHSSANSVDFYVGDRFPADFTSNERVAVAYVAVLGSWIKPEAETGIARVRLTQTSTGYQSEVSWFAQWPGGMPLGLVAGRDGALYVGDYINDTIYRISYGP